MPTTVEVLVEAARAGTPFIVGHPGGESVEVRSQRTTLIAARIDPSGYVAQFNALREL